jgi:uncharacterized small protein (DUF1192 family)
MADVDPEIADLEYYGKRIRSPKKMVCAEFNEERHVVKPGPIPRFCRAFSALDPGGDRDPCGLLLGYWDFARAKLVIVASHMQNNMRTNEISEAEKEEFLEAARAIDLDELMRLHALTATPARDQLCWYDVKPEQAEFFEVALEAVPELVREVERYKELLSNEQNAAKERVTALRAEVERLKAERDAADACSGRDIKALEEVRGQRDQLRAEVEQLKAELQVAQREWGIAKLVVYSEQVEAQLRELREAAARLVNLARLDERFKRLKATEELEAVLAKTGGA